ncbi:MAG: D-Ala-D-Ala carboxypeptidase family metallohydrolase [Pseudomonadota bacterium]
MNLSDHFTLEELCKSQIAERNGIDNSLSEDTEQGRAIIASLRALCVNILEPVRTHYGIPIKPNSGYRCGELNDKLGSKPTSQHIKGEAVDFEIAGVSNHDLAVWIRDNLTFDQLILEHYVPGQPQSGWVHCSYVSSGNRSSVLTINKTGTTRDLVQ